MVCHSRIQPFFLGRVDQTRGSEVVEIEPIAKCTLYI